jgi:manganese efflux pump family protein
MSVYSLLLIALALSLDAFGVALSIGLNRKVRFRNKSIFTLSFGFFQFLFSLTGALAGFLFNTYIASMPGIIGGIIIILVGCLMIREGLDERDACLLFTPKMYIVIGISVSIDALVVGFTALSDIHSLILAIRYTVIIGMVTLLITSGAFIISKFLNRIALISRYADYIGGIILIIFGLKMIFMV